MCAWPHSARRPAPALTDTVVLVHGAFHGGWCWDRIVPGLTGAGLTPVVVDLPGHGVGDPGPVGDLSDDAAHVRAGLDGCAGPVLLVGHSYGGAVITEAAAGRADVGHLVYLAAMVPDVGETIGGASAGVDPGAAWRDVPSTYVLCTDDRTVPVPVQEANAARTGATVTLPTSHSPFFSAPDDLVDVLVAIARTI